MHLHTGTHDILMLGGHAFNWDTLLMTWITGLLVFLIVFPATRHMKIVPDRWQNAIEMIVEALCEKFEGTLGPNYRKAVTVLLTLFMFIFVGNELGLLPTAHLIVSPTNDLNTTLGLAVGSSIIIHILYIQNKGGVKYLKHFFEPFVPFVVINLMEEISKPLTLAMRLFGNILAGEILLEVLQDLAPIGVPMLWIAFSLVIGLIQAFIFTILVTAYLGGALGEGGH